MNNLETIDYITLFFTLLIPCLISFYFAKTPEGERTLGLFPAIMSLTASALSGVSMIGLPSEAYMNGVIFGVYSVVSDVLSVVSNVYCFFPVLYNLNIDSAYEYFELRFDSRVRKLTSFLYILSQVSFAALAVYPPASVISQFSGISIDTSSLGLLIFCTLCTIVGGFKGVVWIDTFQVIVMWAFLIALLILSVAHGGGFTTVLSLSIQSGRLDMFVMDPDPTLRMSFWSGIVGQFSVSLSYSILSHSSFQRYRPLKSERLSRRALYLNTFQIDILFLLMTFCGLGIYATYSGCDPKSARKINNYLNIVAHFIDQVGQNIAGLKGLFIAGIISASLSTMSTNINTAATLIYADFLKDKPFLSQVIQSTAIRLLTVFAGLSSIAFLFLLKGTESIMETFQLFVGAVQGLLVGLFMLGMLCLNSNSKGAFYGGLGSMCLMMTLSLGKKLYAGQYPLAHYKTTSVERCHFNITSTLVPETEPVVTALPHWIFRVTPFYYSFIASASTVILGLVISWLVSTVDRPSGSGKRLLKKELFCPVIVKAYRHRFYREVPLREENQAELNSINEN